MTSHDDHDVRDALRPLREERVEPAEIDTVLARHAREQRPHKARPLRVVAAGVTVAATALAAVALLPSGPTGGDEDRSAQSLLRLAAARAAEQTGAAFDGYRYARIRDRFREPQTDASRCAPPDPAPAPPSSSDSAEAEAKARREAARQVDEMQRCTVYRGYLVRESVREQWVDERWEGRRVAEAWRVVEAVPPFGEDLGGGSDGEYEYGDGALALARLRDLPTDPPRLAETLRAAVRDQRWSPARSGGSRDLPPEMVDYELAYTVIHLIAEARVSPQLRAAAWSVLAGIDTARSLGSRRDAMGREGEGVELSLTYGPPGARDTHHRLVVLFDPEDAQLLSWSRRTAPSGFEARYASEDTHVVEDTGDVSTTADRP